MKARCCVGGKVGREASDGWKEASWLVFVVASRIESRWREALVCCSRFRPCARDEPTGRSCCLQLTLIRGLKREVVEMKTGREKASTSPRPNGSHQDTSSTTAVHPVWCGVDETSWNQASLYSALISIPGSRLSAQGDREPGSSSMSAALLVEKDKVRARVKSRLHKNSNSWEDSPSRSFVMKELWSLGPPHPSYKCQTKARG